MWIVVEVIFSCIDVLFTYLFLRIFLNRKYSIAVLEIGLVILVITIKVLANFLLSDNMIVYSSIAIGSTLILGYACFRAKLQNIVIATMFSFIAGASTEMLAVFMVTGIHGVSMEEIIQLNIYRVQSRTLSYLVYLILIVLINRFMNVRVNIMTSKLMIALCVLPLTSIFIMYQFAVHVIGEMYTPTITETIPLLSIITVNIFVFFLVESLIKQNEKEHALTLIKSQNNANQQHIKHLLDTQNQIKKISHDFKHQVNALRILCEKKQCDKLLTCLLELSSQSNPIFAINTENPMLDTIISSKKEDSEKYGIDLKLELDITPNLSYITVEHCVLLSNGLDNAIEACDRSNGKKKFIDLELTANMTAFMFRIKNTVGEIPEPAGEFLKTKKSDKLRHGIGLQSMKQTCDELGGNMIFEYDENYFEIWIYIPIKGLMGK